VGLALDVSAHCRWPIWRWGCCGSVVGLNTPAKSACDDVVRASDFSMFVRTARAAWCGACRSAEKYDRGGGAIPPGDGERRQKLC